MKYNNRILSLTTALLILFTVNGVCFQADSNLEENEVLVEYIGHASFKISTNNASILLDPFADKVWIGYNYPKGITADAIFSTHPHYDHDGGIYIKKTPYWQDEIVLYGDPGTYEIGDIKITGIKGKHSDPFGKEFGQKNTIWIIEASGLKLAHLGDNGPLFEENIEALNGVDIIMVPMDSEYHILKKEELIELLDQLKPKAIIPMHYKLESLEETPGKPKDLGPVDFAVVKHLNIGVLKTNSQIFSSPLQIWMEGVILFQPSPQLNNN